MIALAEVLRRHWPAYEQKFGARLLPSHRRAVQAICSCRTAALGGQLFGCDCGRREFVYHSCNHRACPQCGHADATQWLDRQRRVCYFGWLSPAAKARFQRIAALLDWRAPTTQLDLKSAPPECPCCKADAAHRPVTAPTASPPAMKIQASQKLRLRAQRNSLPGVLGAVSSGATNGAR